MTEAIIVGLGVGAIAVFAFAFGFLTLGPVLFG